MKDDRFTNPFLHYGLLGSIYLTAGLTLFYHTIGHNIPPIANLLNQNCMPTLVIKTVTINPTSLKPNRLALNRCDTVIFKNADISQHVLAFGTLSKHVDYPHFNNQVLQPGANQRLTLRRKGSYELHDYLNDAITGTIIVK